MAEVAAEPVLRTSRLRLRPLGRADLGEIHALWVDPDVRRYLWDGLEISVDAASDVLSSTERHFRQRRYGIWGVHALDAAALIGFAGARPWPTGEPELLYGLQRTSWGRGLATEAGEAVLAHLFETLGHPRVVAATDPPNAASIRVMERLGMTFDERIEMHGLDTVVYRLSRERWRARQRA